MSTAPIRIGPGEEGRLIVRVPYAPERVAKIKTLAGRRWHQQEQYWTVPQTNGAVTHLLTLFAGEPTEVDSSLDTAGASQQKKPFPESHSELFDRLHVALRARHYARRTEQAYGHWITRFTHLLTCDDQMLRAARRGSVGVQVQNPVPYMEKVTDA